MCEFNFECLWCYLIGWTWLCDKLIYLPLFIRNRSFVELNLERCYKTSTSTSLFFKFLFEIEKCLKGSWMYLYSNQYCEILMCIFMYPYLRVIITREQKNLKLRFQIARLSKPSGLYLLLFCRLLELYKIKLKTCMKEVCHKYWRDLSCILFMAYDAFIVDIVNRLTDLGPLS